jgi:hypothetical protein
MKNKEAWLSFERKFLTKSTNPPIRMKQKRIEHSQLRFFEALTAPALIMSLLLAIPKFYKYMAQ